MPVEPPNPPSSSRLRASLIWTAKIVVSAGLLGLLFRNIDLAALWATTRAASIGWLVVALALYLVMALVSAWRWGVLLSAQRVYASFGWLTNSFLVATFFNNFLPSNIGGDVIRIRDTAAAAGSKTLATTIVLLDRGLGLLGLVAVAAVGSSLAARRSPTLGPIGPGLLWLGLLIGLVSSAIVIFRPSSVAFALSPLRRMHQEWVGERITRLTTALARFGASPRALITGLGGGIAVQLVLVAFYGAVATALRIPIPFSHLAILIPLSFIVQMVPVSVNGLGVREATFTLYFQGLRLPSESAIALSLVGAFLIMLFSTSGAVAYLTRSRQPRRR